MGLQKLYLFTMSWARKTGGHYKAEGAMENHTPLEPEVGIKHLSKVFREIPLGPA